MCKSRRILVSLATAVLIAVTAGCAKREPAPVKTSSQISAYISSGEWKGDTVVESFGSYILPENWMRYDNNSWAPDFVRDDPTNVTVTALEDNFREADFDSFADAQARVFAEKMADSGLKIEEERFTTSSGLGCICLSVHEKSAENGGASETLHDSVSRVYHVHGDKRYVLFIETVFALDHLEEIDALTRAMIDSFSFSSEAEAS